MVVDCDLIDIDVSVLQSLDINKRIGYWRKRKQPEDVSVERVGITYYLWMFW